MADQENLDIQLQINEAIRKRGNLLTKQTQALQKQTDLATTLRDTLGDVNVSEEAVNRLQDLRQVMEEIGEESTETGDITEQVAESLAEGAKEADEGIDGWLNRAQKATKETSLWAGALAGFTDGIVGSFTNITRLLGGVLKIATSVVGGIFQISKAIIAIPFKMFNALVEEATKGGGSNELRRAYEEVRKEFGNFHQESSKHVIGAYKEMRGELAETGLSVRRVTGFMYERLKLITELAKEMGPDWHIFGQEIRQNAEHMIAFQKGLGLTGESMKALSSRTVLTGKTMTETLLDITKFSTSFSARFGISAKLISRDVGEMQQDMKTFGNLGVKTMTQLSVFSRKLGISFKELQGIVDKFDNFEDAAENAAKLSQAFGVNVDVMKLMNEQDPGKRIDMLRTSFFASGRQIEKMTRQERAYLAQTAGVEESALNQVFALKNQATSYNELETAGEQVEKQQLTQAQAMKKLSGAIERMVKDGNRMGGFWDRFLLGIRQGVRWSKDFRGTMRNIRRSLWVAERAGRKVGRLFAKTFPGMQNILKGFREFFDPKKFRKLANGVVSSFKLFFEELGNPATANKALNNLLNNFQKFFGNMIKDETSALGKIVKGFKTAFKAVGTIFLSAGKMIMENLTKAMRAVTSWINDKGSMSLTDAFSKAFEGAGSVIGPILGEIWDEVVKQWGEVAPQLWTATQHLFWSVLNKVGEIIGKWWNEFDLGALIKENPKIAAVIAGYMFGPAFIKAAGSTMIQAFGQSMMGSEVQSGLVKAIQKVGWKKAVMMGAKGGLVAAAVALAALITYKAYEAFTEVRDYTMELDKDFGRIAKRHEEKRKLMDEELKQIGVTKEMMQKLGRVRTENLEKELLLMAEKENLTAEGIDKMKKKEQDALNEQLEKIKTSREKLHAEKVEFQFGLGRSDEEINADLKRMDVEAKVISAKLGEMGTQFNRAAAKVAKEGKTDAAREAALAAADRLKSTIDMGSDISEGELSTFKQIKKLKPKEVKRVLETFRNDIKPLLLQLRDDMAMIGKAFSQEEIGNVILAVQALNQFGGINLKSLTAIGKIDPANIYNATTNIETAVRELSKIGKVYSHEDVGKSVQSADALTKISEVKDALKTFTKSGTIDTTKIKSSASNIGAAMEALASKSLTDSFGKLSIKSNEVTSAAANLQSMGVVVTGVQMFKKQLDRLGKVAAKRDKPVTEMSAVRVISRMVEAANVINTELSRIKAINLKPQLENLGRALGVQGETFTINNRNFQLNVNMTVMIDAEELTTVIKDQKVFLKKTDTT